MGRAPCCDKENVKKGPWSPEEDAKLKEFIEKYGTGGNWIALPQKAGLRRCGKSCRLRWLNYLRPNIKHGEFSEDEDRIICSLYANIGSRWSIIAAQLPGRTDNDIKNYWNTKLKKKLMGMIQSNQRKLPPFSSSLQLLPQQSDLSQLYRDYYSQTKSFTGLESSSLISQNLLYNNNNVNNIAALPATNYSCYPVQENMLIFGGNDHHQTSCSSSDGSCSQNLSYGKEIKQENMGYHHHHQGYNNISSNCYEETQKFILDYGNNNGVGNHQNMTQLQCDLEEVKELISTNNGCNNNNNNINSFCFNDENKTDEREMYYY